MYLASYLSICLFIYLPVRLPVCLSVCLPASVDLSLYLSLSLSISFSFHVFGSLAISPNLRISLFLCLSIYISLSLPPPIFLPIYLSVCLPTFLAISFDLQLHVQLYLYFSLSLSIQSSPATWTFESCPNMWCFYQFDLEIFFAPCTFTRSQPPKVLRHWGVLCILTSKCASHHIGAQFFLSHLPRWPQNIGKHRVLRDFYTFSRTLIFCLLTLSFWLLLFWLFLFSDCSHLHLSILSEVWLLNIGWPSYPDCHAFALSDLFSWLANLSHPWVSGRLAVLPMAMAMAVPLTRLLKHCWISEPVFPQIRWNVGKALKVWVSVWVCTILVYFASVLLLGQNLASWLSWPSWPWWPWPKQRHSSQDASRCVIRTLAEGSQYQGRDRAQLPVATMATHIYKHCPVHFVGWNWPLHARSVPRIESSRRWSCLDWSKFKQCHQVSSSTLWLICIKTFSKEKAFTTKGNSTKRHISQAHALYIFL